MFDRWQGFAGTRSRALVIMAGLMLVVAIGACSSSSSHSSSSPTSSSKGGAAKATGAPITVGIICTCSGSFGTNIAPQADVYKAWANTVDATGGIDGHPVEVTTDDDTGNPGTSISDAQALVSKHVDAIVDVSLVDQTWASTVQAAKIPVVGGNLSEEPFYKNPDFYPEGQTNDSIVAANVLTAKAAGAKNLGDLYCAEAPTCQQGVPLLKAAGTKYGLPVIYNAQISATAPNYTAQCVAAQQAHVSALFIGDVSPVIVRVGGDCNRQGYNPIYITEGEGFGMNIAEAPGAGANLWSGYNNVPFFANTPALQAMNAAVDRYYPGLRNQANAWTELAVGGWASGLLLEDAIHASGLGSGGTPTAAAIIRGLGSLKGDTLQGMSPPLTFTTGQPHPVDCWFTARVQNGTPKVVNNNKLTCENGSA